MRVLRTSSPSGSARGSRSCKSDAFSEVLEAGALRPGSSHVHDTDQDASGRDRSEIVGHHQTSNLADPTCSRTVANGRATQVAATVRSGYPRSPGSSPSGARGVSPSLTTSGSSVRSPSLTSSALCGCRRLWLPSPCGWALRLDSSTPSDGARRGPGDVGGAGVLILTSRGEQAATCGLDVGFRGPRGPPGGTARGSAHAESSH
jgi:hypothetical protein